MLDHGIIWDLGAGGGSLDWSYLFGARVALGLGLLLFRRHPALELVVSDAVDDDIDVVIYAFGIVLFGIEGPVVGHGCS
jgi:hypothetical protein